jgi:Protein of unknown function (DUF3866)
MMISLRRGTVAAVVRRRPGLVELRIDVEGETRPAIAFEEQTGPVSEGDAVVLNASAVQLGLGTGGYDFVIAVEGGTPRDHTSGGHAMKLRYTPVQSVVEPVEETHAGMLDAFDGLRGAPVVLCGLHSMLPAVAVGARSVAAGARIAYVMTDAAALPLVFSDTVAAMREAGLLDVTITAGQAFGGDLEAVNVYGAIAAASAVADADVIVAGIGPGNLGTGSRLGTTFLDQATLVDAVDALGGEAVVVPRLSMADPRERHRGLSHHTQTALTLARGGWTLVVPRLGAVEQEMLEAQLDAVSQLAASRPGCRWLTVDDDALIDALATSPVPLRTMGRSFGDDPLPFRAAAAAGIYAVRPRPPSEMLS